MQGIRDIFRVAPVTVVLAGLAVAIYVAQALLWSGEGPPDVGEWALSGQALSEGRWWTLVTHLFLHGNLLHLFVNVLALWFIGPEVERTLGSGRFLLLYFAAGVAGGLLQIAFSAPQAQLVGSSGAVCGVLLSFTTAYPDRRLQALLFFIVPVNMKARTLGWGLIVFSLVLAVLNILPQIGHLAHLGGALVGAGLTWWWRRRSPGRPAGAAGGSGAARADDLLRRLAEEGLESLSREERQTLEQWSQRPRRRW